MRTTVTAIMLLALGAAPLSAQLTADQRREREAKDLSLSYNRMLATRLEQRALAGDASAYGGPAACTLTAYTWATNCRGYYGYRPWLANPSYTGPWITVGATPRGIRSLVRADGARVKAKAETASVLTLASPAGEIGRALEVRTTVDGGEAAPTWNSTHLIIGDEQERYLVQLPAFAAGTYKLKVEIFDPVTPDTPVTSSTSTFTVR